MNRIDLLVADVGELATVHVAEIVDGANAWVTAEGDYWTLVRFSGTMPPPGANVVAPLAGAPIAGGSNALWIRQVTGSASNWVQSVDAQLAVDVDIAGAVYVPFLSAVIGKASGASKLIVRGEITGVIGGAGGGGEVGMRIDGGVIKPIQVNTVGRVAWSTAITEVFTGLPAGPHTVELLGMSNAGPGNDFVVSALSGADAGSAHIDIFEVLT